MEWRAMRGGLNGKTLAAKLAVGLLGVYLIMAPRVASAQEWTTPPSDAPSAPPQPSQAAAPPPQAEPPAEPPSVAPPQPVAPAADGQWVYSDTYGWIWVPAGTTSSTVESEPYVYLYTPTYGWTWYASPWGWGPFFVGPWVHRAFVPHVWYGSRWVRGGIGAHYGYRGGARFARPYRGAPGYRAPAFHASHAAPAFHGGAMRPVSGHVVAHPSVSHRGGGGGGGHGGGHHR